MPSMTEMASLSSMGEMAMMIVNVIQGSGLLRTQIPWAPQARPQRISAPCKQQALSSYESNPNLGGRAVMAEPGGGGG